MGVAFIGVKMVSLPAHGHAMLVGDNRNELARFMGMGVHKHGVGPETCDHRSKRWLLPSDSMAIMNARIIVHDVGVLPAQIHYSASSDGGVPVGILFSSTTCIAAVGVHQVEIVTVWTATEQGHRLRRGGAEDDLFAGQINPTIIVDKLALDG